ncbi:type II secretion system F family protein [Patescibacteria group bacterium]|nr:type II secretion system F family protein [Patescibacteria group bacterium]MBU1703138.1 type II secretion system F family protein [Patescibacteria group bacterium]MBU1954140.1 type II secretion system F family protein [Patescibacteria group bacterium]
MINLNINLGGIKREEILLFTQLLAFTLRSGLTVTEGIEIAITQSKGKMKDMLLTIQNSVNTGKSFSRALSAYPKYFSPFYINMIKTGEYSGNLEENLKRLAEHLSKAERLKKSIKSAMIYPTFILVAMTGIGFAIALFVLPILLPLFQSLNVELPPTTKALVFVAQAFETNGFNIVLGFNLGIVGLVLLLRRNFIKPLLHRFYLSIPVLNTIVININLQRFTNTLSTLLKSGLTVDESINIISDAIDNRVYRKALKSAIPKIEGGDSVESVLNKSPKLFSEMVTKMIGVGEKTGTLEDTLAYLGDYYEEMVDNTVKNLASIIEPLLLIVVGIMVGTVALSIISPIAELTASVSA